MKFKRVIQYEKGFDMTPLIDVVFQLLIFFMLTSSFIAQPGIKINLPKAVTSEVVQEAKNATITLTKENLLYFNEKLISESELKEKLTQAAKARKTMLIKADRGTPLGKVVGIWDLCRDSGITQINIATNREVE
jgi:biopolymer transport protein ExbD